MTEGAEWICTFGFGHELPDGTPLRGKFVRIRALCRTDVALQMHERFGNRWAFCYDSEEAAGVERYGLTELREVGL